jgi:hypothetical protein
MEWLISLLVPAIITIVTLIITNKIQQSRLPYQNNADRADANSKTMEAYERIASRLETVEGKYAVLLERVNGTVVLKVELQMDELYKNGVAHITGTAEILKTP